VIPAASQLPEVDDQCISAWDMEKKKQYVSQKIQVSFP
jgi:hypothetical protein